MFLNLLRGIHVPHRKDTADCPPQRIPIPATVSLPMSMHIGKPALPTVKPGDLVKVGQRIARAGRPHLRSHPRQRLRPGAQLW